jgi:hypothetical protein
MKTQTLFRISRIIILAVFVSLVVLALVYALQAAYPNLLASVSWNG